MVHSVKSSFYIICVHITEVLNITRNFIWRMDFTGNPIDSWKILKNKKSTVIQRPQTSLLHPPVRDMDISSARGTHGQAGWRSRNILPVFWKA
jgi:hypothetical protein